MQPIEVSRQQDLALSLKLGQVSVAKGEYTAATILIENHGETPYVLQELFGSSGELRFYARSSNGELVANLDFGGIDGGMELVKRVVKLRPGFIYGAKVRGVRFAEPGSYTVWCVLTKPDLTEHLGSGVWHGQLSSPAVKVVVRSVF